MLRKESLEFLLLLLDDGLKLLDGAHETLVFRENLHLRLALLKGLEKLILSLVDAPHILIGPRILIILQRFESQILKE